MILHITRKAFKGIVEITVATRIQEEQKIEPPRAFALNLVNVFEFMAQDVVWYLRERR
jgi:hypothetical protein